MRTVELVVANIGGTAFLELAAKARTFLGPRTRYVLALLETGSQSRRIDPQLEGDQLHVLVDEIPRIRARVQFIGSRNEKTRLWRWSWAQPDRDARLTEDAMVTRAYGEKQAIYELTAADLPDDNNFAYQLTSIAAMLCSGDALWPLRRDGMPTDYVVLHQVVSLNRASA